MLSQCSVVDVKVLFLIDLSDSFRRFLITKIGIDYSFLRDYYLWLGFGATKKITASKRLHIRCTLRIRSRSKSLFLFSIPQESSRWKEVFVDLSRVACELADLSNRIASTMCFFSSPTLPVSSFYFKETSLSKLLISLPTHSNNFRRLKKLRNNFTRRNVYETDYYSANYVRALLSCHKNLHLQVTSSNSLPEFIYVAV